MWNRLKAKWRGHDEVLASRELHREAVEGEVESTVPGVVTPYLDAAAQPSTGFSHPERSDEDAG